MTPPSDQLKNARYYMVIKFENVTQAYGVNSVSEFKYYQECNGDYECFLLQNPYFINYDKNLREKLEKQKEINMPQSKAESATN